MTSLRSAAATSATFEASTSPVDRRDGRVAVPVHVHAGERVHAARRPSVRRSTITRAPLAVWYTSTDSINARIIDQPAAAMRSARARASARGRGSRP